MGTTKPIILYDMHEKKLLIAWKNRYFVNLRTFPELQFMKLNIYAYVKLSLVKAELVASETIVVITNMQPSYSYVNNCQV